jgi:NAD(P)-dependent dehydrogenase (short-subunit alcohol dehydrogenase family)
VSGPYGSRRWIAPLVVGGAAFVVRRIAQAQRAIDLRRAVVLITGASRGLGLVLARTFGAAGARVAICARDANALERARRDLAARGIDVLAVPCDVTDATQVAALVAQVRETLGHIDVLVNNAGEIEVGPLEELTPGDFDVAMRTHFWAAVHTVLAVLPEMRRRHGGRIVNIASIGGKISVPHLAAYSASKYALVGLSRALRAELRGAGVLVTTVCPGLMRTGSHRRATFKGRHRAEFTWFSIGGALPFLSTSAEHGARRIVAACRRGDAELVLTIPAKLADAFSAALPGLTADLLSAVNRLLPGPGGIGPARAEGRHSESRWSPSALTVLSDSAAARHNE